MGGYLSKKEENEDALANDWGLMVHLQRIGVGVPLKCLERAFPSSGEYLSSTAPSMKRALDMVMSKTCCRFWQIGIVLVAVQGLGDWPHVLGQSVAESSERQTLFRRYLQEHCASCHNQDQKEGNLTLDSFTGFEEASRSPEHWWKVLKNVRAGLMPPHGEPKPSDAEQKEFVDAIKYSIFKIDPRSPDPGRLTVRRLNRTEYANTIRDLMGVRFEAEILFPPDDSGHGFDNIGDALTFSPMLMDKYFQAAQAVVELAVPKKTWQTPVVTLAGTEMKGEGDSRGDRLDGKQKGKVRGSMIVPESGTFRVAIAFRLHGSFDFDPARYTVVLTVDGKTEAEGEYGWDENKLIPFSFEREWNEGAHEVELTLTPLPRKEGSEFSFPGQSTFVRFEMQHLRAEGPIGTERKVHPDRYQRFFHREDPPTDASERRLYAREVLTKFCEKAFRGEVDTKTIGRLVDLAERRYSEEGVTFEQGIGQAMVAILASPRFLFRLENGGSDEIAGDLSNRSQVDERTLANRLSYFLWSTMPDDELMSLVEHGKLRAELEPQLHRMLRDPKAEQFTRNFVGQWLRTRDVTQISVDPIGVLGYQKEFDELLEQFRNRRGRRGFEATTPEEQKARDRFRELRGIADRFDNDLRRAMRRETEMCVEYLVKEDRSVLDLLDCNYTFLNDKLATHYGITGVRGGDMRKVDLPEGSPRGGVLTHASMHLVTSNPTRTSPVKRGLFVLENILGTPSAPAPPGSLIWKSLAIDLPEERQRCENYCRCTGNPHCAHRVMHGWTLWGWRSRISMLLGNGVTMKKERRSTQLVGLRQAKSFKTFANSKRSCGINMQRISIDASPKKC